MTDSRCHIYPRKAAEIKKGDYAILRGRPCHVVEVHHAKTGKHGHLKARLVGIDLLHDGKLDWMGAGHLQVHGFEPIKQLLLFLALEDEVASCLDDASKVIPVDMPTDHPLRSTLADPDWTGYLTVVLAPVEVPGREDVFRDEARVKGLKRSD